MLSLLVIVARNLEDNSQAPTKEEKETLRREGGKTKFVDFCFERKKVKRSKVYKLWEGEMRCGAEFVNLASSRNGEHGKAPVTISFDILEVTSGFKT